MFHLAESERPKKEGLYTTINAFFVPKPNTLSKKINKIIYKDLGCPKIFLITPK